MSRANIVSLTCDRCNLSDQQPSNQIVGWTKMNLHLRASTLWAEAANVDHRKTVERADLCPSCTMDLRRWWDRQSASAPTERAA
jgi:hypothetical protein